MLAKNTHTICVCAGVECCAGKHTKIMSAFVCGVVRGAARWSWQGSFMVAECDSVSHLQGRVNI